jgi:M6 family metalloprotease-like protein
MSLNKLKFTGKVVSVTTPQTRQWYLNNSKKRYHIHKDIIEQLDQTWDFAEFDRWTKVSDYTHANNPDGKVDFIFFIWRNIAMDLPSRDSVMTQLDMGWWGSIAKTVHGPNYSVDGGQRTIILGDFGSGCTVGDYYFKDAFRFSIHEFAHYLLGGNEYHNGHAFWAMLSGYEVRSYMVNSWERYRLGWSNLITVNTSTQTISNASLPDYLTTGISYRIEINAPSNEYFFIENHQRISRWDNCSQGDPNEKGIYVMRQDRASSSNRMAADWMWLVPAEGRFNWTVSQWTPNRWGSGYLPVFKKGTTNRETGYSSTDAIPVYNPYIGQTKNYEILFIEGPNGEVIPKPMRNGYGYDAFRLGYNEVFSPWSNPNSQRANRNSTGIGFKINSVINGVYTIDIYINTAINAPPSKPQNLKLSTIQQNGESYPKLTWQVNTEPDVNPNGKYEIWRRVSYGSWSNWDTVRTVNGSISEFIDTTIYGAGAGPNHVEYKIRAKDTQGLFSVYSDVVGTAWGLSQQKSPPDKGISVVHEYKLYENYPNPFNPKTKIKFSTPHSAFITLKVYDLLGREVAVLVNEPKQAGEYEVEFNADKYGLTSGLYFYQLTAGSFSSTKKFVYLR